MILPMKKITLMVMDKNKDASLEKLRALGLLHLEKRDVQSEKLNSLLETKTKTDQAKGILTSYAPKKAKKNAKSESVSVVTDLTAHVLSLANQKKLAQDKLTSNAKELNRIEKWGDFEPETFKYFKSNNLILIPYELSKKAYAELGDKPVIVITKDKTMVRCVSIGAAIEGETPFMLPNCSLSAIKREQDDLNEEIQKIDRSLSVLYPQIDSITKEQVAIKQDIEFETAKGIMETMDDAPKELTVSWITGFVPSEDLGHIKRAAADNGWALVADDPEAADDEVPTKLKNNKLVSLIYPLTGFLETVPGYHETDISGVFLLFFCVFFGMLFGDAGYGLLLLMAGLIGIAKTAKTGVPAAFKFMVLLAVANTAWGVLTCTWFGIDVGVLPQILKDISFMPISNVSAALTSITCPIIGTGETLTLSGADYTSQNLQVFCFCLALIQLTFAHVKGFLGAIRAKSLKLFAELGAIAMLWGMFALILYLVVSSARFPFLGPQFLNIVLGLIGGGFAANFIFAGYEGSIIGSIVNSLKNIITVVLGLTNVFSDIMSYIRLWAVGLAGASISATVNGMATQIFDASAAPIAGKFVIFLGILLVIFGHSLNMVLNTLSVLVHGVRLNTLEFSGHIGLTWSGVAYKPFSNKR
ncbi:MAG: V-type ATP synthase subunit I [Termitinemataceae bacterium]|nr:MAG: V-type ATP synthase subunit I [Termitinemataceae bacterium]